MNHIQYNIDHIWDNIFSQKEVYFGAQWVGCSQPVATFLHVSPNQNSIVEASYRVLQALSCKNQLQLRLSNL